MPSTLYLSPISLIVQYLTNLGIIAGGGQVSTYVAGTVNTPATTYADSSGLIANANPLVLSAAGRPVSASGAPVAFWTQPGVALKLVVTDSVGNLLVGPIDNISSINDLTNVNNSLATLLASAASANVSGVGPVGGADFVANAVKSYDVFASVRSANAPTPVSGQTLIIEVEGANAVGDNLGGQFYWSAASAAADDGRTVLKPASVTGPGRWLRLFPLGVPIITYKGGDQQVASSTVLVDDSVLQATLTGGQSYLVSLRLALLGTGGTGQGWKVRPTFSGTVSSTSSGGGASSGNGTAGAQYATLNADMTNAAISSTSGDFINIDFVLVVSATGTFKVQFAQNSSSVNATIMKAGSSMLIRRVA